MELINRTYLAAHLNIGQIYGTNRRMGVLAAKGTFCILPDGHCEPDLDDPFPIYKADEETPLGLLPRDDCPKDDSLDVIILGHAYAGKRAVTHMQISIEMGSVKRSLNIFGDRYWQGNHISVPQPFEKLPLTYANAFGGKCEVEIDKGTVVTLSDPRNQDGKGFNAEAMIPSLVHQYQPPEGFPRFEKQRDLPNIEDPARPIHSPEDSPEPACWATVPLSTATQAFRAMGITPEECSNPELLQKKKNIGPTSALFHRAHPSLDLDMNLLPGTEVILTGLTPEGRLAFRLPISEVAADIVLGEKTAEVKLRPDTLVLLPDEKRLYIVSRLNFTYAFEPGAERSVRLTTIDPAH